MQPDDLAKKIPQDLDALRERLMSRIVLTVEANSKRVAPVLTGNLRRSITSRVTNAGRRGIVGTNVNYARVVHDGTRRRRGKPFFTQGLAASRDTINRFVQEAGDDLMRDMT